MLIIVKKKALLQLLELILASWAELVRPVSWQQWFCSFVYKDKCTASFSNSIQKSSLNLSVMPFSFLLASFTCKSKTVSELLNHMLFSQPIESSTACLYLLSSVISYQSLSLSYCHYTFSISTHVERKTYHQVVKFGAKRLWIMNLLLQNRIVLVVDLLPSKVPIGCK